MNRLAPIRVMVVDDQALIRRGLELVLGTEPDLLLVASVGSGEEAVAAVSHTPCDVVLLDLSMPGMGGVRAAGILARSACVVMLSSSDDPVHVRACLDAGAVGYVTKDVSPERLAAVVRLAAEGLSIVHKEHLRSTDATPAASGPAILTERELVLLRLVALGRTNAEIGRGLSISEATVRTHITHINQKLGARNRTEAVAMARQRALLD